MRHITFTLWCAQWLTSSPLARKKLECWLQQKPATEASNNPHPYTIPSIHPSEKNSEVYQFSLLQISYLQIQCYSGEAYRVTVPDILFCICDSCSLFLSKTHQHMINSLLFQVAVIPICILQRISMWLHRNSTSIVSAPTKHNKNDCRFCMFQIWQ